MPVVYTAIAGNYPIRRDDIVCFTGDGIFQNSVMEAKRYKVLPHLFFPDAITIWVDGNISLRAPPETVVGQLLGDADMALFRHPYRKTVWQEFATLKDDPRFAIPYLQQQLSRQCQSYLESGLPAHTPLFECSVLIRRNTAAVNRMMEAWWAQICRWQWRDQVSLPYVLAAECSGLRLKAIDGNARDHPLFKHVEQWPTKA